MTPPRRRRRRTYKAPIADKVSGVLATYPGTCPRCDRAILPRQDRVVVRNGQPIHVQCAPGADE